MTRPGIEPRSPGPLVNTLTIMPMSGKIEIELTICIKMDLALNNLQRLICHKLNQPTRRKEKDLKITIITIIFMIMVRRIIVLVIVMALIFFGD